jgi:hypothetical protein
MLAERIFERGNGPPVSMASWFQFANYSPPRWGRHRRGHLEQRGDCHMAADGVAVRVGCIFGRGSQPFARKIVVDT